MAPPEDELLTIEEAAKRLKIQCLELRRLLQGKILPAVQIAGSSWRISAAALTRFMERSAPKGE